MKSLSRLYSYVVQRCFFYISLAFILYRIVYVSFSAPLGYPGFITKFRGTDKVPDKPDSDTVDFENYRHVCHKWHYKETCSKSTELVLYIVLLID
jgi:hypothetical protein